MSKIVGVIGLGSISLRHRKNLKELFPSYKVIAVSARGGIPNEDVEDADLIVSGVQELLDLKPYMVIIASPATLHAEHAIAMIKAGVPVLIEKPLTASASDSQAIVNASVKFNTPAVAGYCLRYMPSSQKVKEILGQEVIGNIYNASVNIGQFLPQWRPDKNYLHSVSAQPSLGGGVLLELSHEFDYVQWLLGDMTCEYAQLRNSSELDLEVEELADVVLSSKLGVVCSIHLDFLQKQPQRVCSLIGSKGRIEWDLLGNSITLYTKDAVEVLYSEPKWDKNKMYLNMLRDFDSMIKGERHQCIDLIQASKTIVLIEQIKQSAVWGAKQ
ncbi:MAG: gfo/Idh/MocA family oxidoreductase [Gammaproteobacteria bacterium]|nr:MAG: gfo/Idh/MocA family oxidoreductase [Gammaproteobacteria bacterium]